MLSHVGCVGVADTFGPLFCWVCRQCTKQYAHYPHHLRAISAAGIQFPRPGVLGDKDSPKICALSASTVRDVGGKELDYICVVISSRNQKWFVGGFKREYRSLLSCLSDLGGCLGRCEARRLQGTIPALSFCAR